MKRILIIKLGALGDFFMAQQAFSALRRHHAQDELTLMTIPSLAALAKASVLFDAVIEDPRERGPLGHWRIAQRLRRACFDFIYDLQGNGRTAWYWRFLWPHRPPWSGPVAGCSHPRPPRPPNRPRIDWYHAQLTALGVSMPSVIDVSWLYEDIARLELPPRFALLVAGGSAHRPGKRWPVENYVAIAKALVRRGVTPVLIGTGIDAAANCEIKAQVHEARDLTDQTTIPGLASVARLALGALGNDTGPMHVIAAAGCASVVLFSSESDPLFIAPTGPKVACVQRQSLAALAPGEVLDAIDSTW